MLNGFKKKREANLYTNCGKDHVINGGNVKVENAETEALEPNNHPRKLPVSFLHQYLYVGMSIHQTHFYIRDGT